MRLLFVFAVIIIQSIYVMGHGSMVSPITWFDAGGAIGMKEYGHCAACPGSICSCMWFNNETFVPEVTMKDDYTRTYFDVPMSFPTPWRAPGSAKIHSPCGIGGGNPTGCPAGDPKGVQCPGGGFGFGPDARATNFTDVVTTEWKVGSVVEAAWGIQANHGGGYSYRLCKVPKEGYQGLTEECFNQGHLNFANEMQFVQYGEDPANRTSFKANYTNVGTFPAGSQWAKNPIPACNTPDGGSYMPCIGTQFPPPAPGLYGFGEHAPLWKADFAFSIVDQLQVPEHLTPGNYVLSFRWDCEQTPQVWNTCSNIKIIA